SAHPGAARRLPLAAGRSAGAGAEIVTAAGARSNLPARAELPEPGQLGNVHPIYAPQRSVPESGQRRRLTADLQSVAPGGRNSGAGGRGPRWQDADHHPGLPRAGPEDRALGWQERGRPTSPLGSLLLSARDSGRTRAPDSKNHRTESEETTHDHSLV